MTNREIVPVELHDDTFRTMIELADRLHKSGFAPQALKNAGQVLAVILTGRELGIGPMASLRNISIINQRASLSAELLASLIKQAHGYDALQLVSSDDTQATFRYKSRGMTEYAEYSYTMEKARKAQLTAKDVWQKYPADMLRARCVSNIARIAFQDVSLGLYTTEELESIPVDTSNDIQAEYTVTTEQPKPPAPGPPPADPLDPENGHARKMTQSQGKELTAVRKALAIDDEALKAIVLQRYDASSLKDLNYHQSADLIAYLQSLLPDDTTDVEFEEI
jgi:hypothetical protein